MFPNSRSTCRLAASFHGCNCSLPSMLSRIARPPGCTAQKRLFQSGSVYPTDWKDSSKLCWMLSLISIGTWTERWKSMPVLVACMPSACSVPGIMVCEAATISNNGHSPSENGPAPTIIAPAPSPNSPCPTILLSSGVEKHTRVSSESATRTRAPRLFSASSLASWSALPPPEQPWRLRIVRETEGRRPRSDASWRSALGARHPE
ncbi:Os10g0168000 [Oryza sativa Japonica Group]|uniref:Os10g0168000 protein n=1 Tax=Oryza sativa subsp. japonica TaxID=39947 RepID=A0A0P0XRZ5_ORYSJ|nr:Os10g0168000 [Oryza sativa Japonica Group]